MNPEVPTFSALSADSVLYEENDLIAHGGPVVELDVLVLPTAHNRWLHD